MSVLNTQSWTSLPFHFWSVWWFLVGAVVGSFLNVCIHRLPRDQSLVRPGSRCPACQEPIPWHLNIPLVSWLQLRGRCRFCGTAVSPRYFLVELLTAALFLACWLAHGATSAWLALVYAVFLSGLVVATFIDWEHFIIPDVVTLGGTGAGFVGSFLLPVLQRATSPVTALQRCALGAVLGGATIYAMLRLGKLLFGRQRCPLPPRSRVVFLETDVVLPGKTLPYEELFYRKSDAIALHAYRVEMIDRCYWDVPVRLTQETLRLGEETFRTAEVPCFEVETGEVVVPREAMGQGDVKFMAMIGAFLGWSGVLFSLLGSAMLGSAVGLTLIALRRRAWSSRIPYGPYLAVAAAFWVFAGDWLLNWYLAPAGPAGTGPRP